MTSSGEKHSQLVNLIYRNKTECVEFIGAKTENICVCVCVNKLLVLAEMGEMLL